MSLFSALQTAPLTVTSPRAAANFATCSTRGPRTRLEDAAGALRLASCGPAILDATIAVVCDGVGGNRAGDLASRMAVQHGLGTLSAVLVERMHTSGMPSGELPQVVHAVLERTNAALLERAMREPDCQGMATTIVMGVVLGEDLLVAWAGDSRCYVQRRGRLLRVTHDHRKAEELVPHAGLLAADAEEVRTNHTITRCLGLPDGPAPEILHVALLPADRVLLCTDGLTDVLPDEEIAQLLGTGDVREAAEELVATALAAETTDNTTVLIYEHPQPEPSSPVADAQRTRTGAYARRVAEALSLEDVNHE